MAYRSENAVFSEIRNLSDCEIRLFFSQSKDGLYKNNNSVYAFTYGGNSQNWIAISKDSMVVNADFGFAKCAGSNNYPILLDIGRQIAYAFGLDLVW